MKKFALRAVAAFIICALAGLTALADGKSDRITFGDSFQLNGTTIKKGTYKVSFDEAKGELSIKKDEKVIASAPAHAVPAPAKADRTKYSMVEENGAQVLRSVTYGGESRTIVVGAATGTNGGGSTN